MVKDEDDSDKFMKMKTLPKVVLVLAVVNLIVGLFVTISPRELPGFWYLAMPLAFVFTGLFVIMRFLQSELVIFDEDQRRQSELARHHAVSTAVASPTTPDTLKSADTEPSPPHQMSAEGLWLRGAIQMPRH